MALFHSPRIITDGLVLALDAANVKSYPGSGTTWNDLSGNGNNGTLTNGPTFDSANLGSLVFDGVDDYVVHTDVDISNNFSYDIWCFPTNTHEIDAESTSGTTGTTGQRYLITSNFRPDPDSGAGVSIGTNGVSVYEHAPSYLPALLVHQVTLNTITHIVINYVNKRPALYINGIFVKNGLTSPRTNVKMSTSNIGRTPSYGYYSGRLYSAKFYNRALTAQEVLQNYNATKGRYGL